jgi:hypothetical protein
MAFLRLVNRESLITPYDPASIVDIKGDEELDQSAWGIDCGDRAIAQQERIGSRVIGVRAHNLAAVVDAEGQTAARGAGNIDGREHTSV